MGTGGGAFAAPRTYGVGAGPFFTAVADLNRTAGSISRS